MSKFCSKNQTDQEIPTAALPDIIFMLLFFFMVTTVMRETTLLVDQDLPTSQQVKSLKRKSLTSYLYLGKPKDGAWGDTPKVQANDKFITTNDIVMFIERQTTAIPENEQSLMSVSLKVDKNVKMGLLSDVQQELRKANALRIMYNSPKKN